MIVFSTRFVAALATCWTALVWGNWFAHTPVSPGHVLQAVAALIRVAPGPAAAAAGNHLVLAARLGWLGFAALGAGIPALRFVARGTVPLARSTAIALGAGLLGLGVFGAGCAGLLFGAIGWIATALCVAAAVAAGGPFLAAPDWRWMTQPGCRVPAAVAGVALGLGLLGALAPEVSFDALAHHLAHPQVYAAAHKVVALPYHFLSHNPALAEMQYLLALLVGGGPALAKLIHFGWGVLTAAAIAGWARETLEDRWALSAVAGFLLLPYVQVVLMWAYVDLAAAGYLILAIRAAATGPGGAVLAGVLAGMALGTKTTGAFAVVLAAGLLAHAGASRRRLAGFAAASLAVALPWGCKNWAFTGNPVAPFGSAILPTLWWGPGNQSRYAAELASYVPGRLFTPLRLFAQPWRTSVLNEGVLDRMAGMGAWFLWGLPLLAVAGAGSARTPALAAAGFFVLWLCVPRQSRYLLPAWPLAALATAHAVRALARRGGLALVPVWAAGAVLAVHLGLAFEREHFIINPEPVVFGAESTEAYLERGLPEKPYSVRMARVLRGRDDGGRVLVVSQYGLALLWGGRGISPSAFDTPLIERWSAESFDPAGIRRRFRQAGVTRVLYSMQGGFLIQSAYAMYGFTPAAAARWRAFWDAYPELDVNQDDRFLLFRIARRPGHGRGAGILPGLDEQWLGVTDAAVRKAEQDGTIAAMLPRAESSYAAIAAASRSACAFERLGSIRLREGRFPGARAALAEAERLGRRTSVLYDALGVVEARLGEPGPAVARFRRALAIEPGLADARRNLAQLLWQLGDREAALGTLREGLGLDPGSGDLGSLWTAWTGQPTPGR